ncbi:MAG TPA: LysR substrate-binding domain-containing protein [Gaiellaceae bacterium]|nr:LysR substrate-binding domain-containing protein [Gaiellaceae bacterium]
MLSPAALAAHAAEAMHTLEAGEEELRRLAKLEAGTIRLGASTTPGVYLLPDTLGCFRRDHPKVTVEVEIASTGEILDRLLAGRIQLALVGEARADERVRLEPFIDDEIVGVARPGLLDLRDGRARPSDLAEQTLLVREAGSSTRRVSERPGGRRRVAESRLGARVQRGDQARRPRRARDRLPLALRGRRLGLPIHVMNGLVFGFVYGIAWWALAPDPANAWWIGLVFGAVHAVVAMVMMPVMSAMHPRVRDRGAVEAGASPSGEVTLPPFGFGGTGFGSMTPVGILMGHLVFGLVWGLVFRWLV